MLMLKKQLLALSIGALILGFASQASALSYTLNDSFGSVPVSGEIVITLTDAGADTVMLEIDMTALNSSEFVKELYLNTETEVTGISGSGFAGLNWDTSETSNKSDGDGYHDLFIEFATRRADRLTGGEIYTFTLTGSGLIASDFEDIGTLSDKGQFHAVAKINGTGDGSGSDWVGDGGGGSPVPEPTSAVLFLAGALVVGQATRRVPAKVKNRA